MTRSQLDPTKLEKGMLVGGDTVKVTANVEFLPPLPSSTPRNGIRDVLLILYNIWFAWPKTRLLQNCRVLEWMRRNANHANKGSTKYGKATYVYKNDE